MQAHFFSGPDGRQAHGMHPTTNPVARALGPVRPDPAPYKSQDPAYTRDVAHNFLHTANTGRYNDYVRECATTRAEKRRASFSFNLPMSSSGCETISSFDCSRAELKPS